MRKLIMAIAVLMAMPASAIKVIQQPVPIYLAKDGTQLSPPAAMEKSIKGEPILKCEAVEYQVTAKGSGGFKKVK